MCSFHSIQCLLRVSNSRLKVINGRTNTCVGATTSPSWTGNQITRLPSRQSESGKKQCEHARQRDLCAPEKVCHTFPLKPPSMFTHIGFHLTCRSLLVHPIKNQWAQDPLLSSPLQRNPCSLVSLYLLPVIWQSEMLVHSFAETLVSPVVCTLVPNVDLASPLPQIDPTIP